MNTSGNTVLITGGAAGIGLALAKELLTRKNLVIVCDLKEERLSSLKKEIPAVETLVCDVTLPSDRVRLLETVEKNFPKINFFVNNAGVAMWHNFLKPESDLDQKIQVEVNTNLLGPMELTRLFLPLLLKQEKSILVNVTSALAYLPLALEPVYCATKAGLHSFSQSLRYQLKGTPVQVVEVLSSWVDTEMAQNVDTKKINPERVATEVLKGIEGNREEIRIGLAGPLYYISRLAPKWMFNQINKNTPPH